MIPAPGNSPAAVAAQLEALLPTMLANLELLVNSDSPSDNLEALRACAAILQQIGMEVAGRPAEVFEVQGRQHLLWRWGEPRLLVVGHYDTVWPIGTAARWPFRVDGERATGPGVFDMKAGLIQGLYAIAALPHREGVAYLVTADEELGAPTSRRLIESTARGLEAALVLEASHFGAVKVARKGISMYDVTISGKSAHASEPQLGVNATEELAHQVLRLARLGRPDLGTSVTPTAVSSGTTRNTIPGRATIEVDVRAGNPVEQRRVDREINALLPVLPGAVVEVTGGINRPPLVASDDLLLLAERVAAELGWHRLENARVSGGSDGNLTSAVGTPTLDGLGAVGADQHAEGEHILWAHMPARAALLSCLISALLGGSGVRPRR